ncbi:hypothetical protein AALN73_11095 [Bacteroides stercorirosoris]|jgi:hypothetical protein|uniref:hypothetical protein n=1 Tax=Bacteroides stercorirosoris TaxID=871324 RepID=UPI001114BBCA|nr:hypothetical protein [Bacteroides stercorirosoris]
MKKCILFLCVLICAIAYAGNADKDTRLSTGKKVNSVIDNPSFYSKSQSLKKQGADSVMSPRQDIQKSKRTLIRLLKF